MTVTCTFLCTATLHVEALTHVAGLLLAIGGLSLVQLYSHLHARPFALPVVNNLWVATLSTSLWASVCNAIAITLSREVCADGACHCCLRSISASCHSVVLEILLCLRIAFPRMPTASKGDDTVYLSSS